MDGVAATLGKGSKCKMKFNKEMLFTLPSGVKVVNATPHPINMINGDNEFVIPASGMVLGAKFVETGSNLSVFPGVEITTSATIPTEDGIEFLDSVPFDVLVIGSKIAAETYKGRVAMLNPAPGFERVAPSEKRMSCVKFTMFE